MGTRTVTTVFAVSGEKDYRQAVQNINRDIKVLDSALKLNAEKWKGQEDAMVALKEKSTILNDLYKKQEEKVGAIETAWKNCKDAAEKYKGQIDKIEQAIKDTKGAMDKLSGEGKTDSDVFTNLGKKLESLEKELDTKKGMYDAAIRGAQNWETALNNASTELLEIENQLNPALDALANKVAPAFDNVTDSIQDVGDEADEMKRELPSAVEATAKLVAAAGLDRAFEKVRDAMQACIEKSVQFETDVAGVFKTVDLTADEEQEMADAIKDLSTRIPATTTEITGVAEAAGQLGIAKEDILAFSEVMLKLGTTTNLGSIAAAESLAKLANITELDVKDYERLGSAIVELGNNGSSSEEQIVEMATRMAATGDIVGMTVQDMLAYATALADVGVEAEAGGSSISKMFRKLQLAVETNKLGETMYDDIAGMSPEEFAKLWGDDPARALLAFIEGLQRMEDEGTSAVAILDEMGIVEIRLSNGMLALTAAGELLEEHLDRAYKAWDENTALEEEAAKRYETMESKLTILGNAFSNFQTAIGDDFNKTLEPMVENLTGLLNAGTNLAEKSDGISTGLAAIGGGLGTITGLTTGAAIIGGIVDALKLFGPHAGAIALGAGAVGALAGAVINLVNNSEGVSASVQEVLDANDAILKKTESSKTIYEESMAAAEQNKEKVNDLIEKLWKFYEEGAKTPETEAIIKGSVDRLNELLPGLGLTYDGVTDKINMTRREMQMFAEDAANQKMLDALNEYLDALTGNELGLKVQKKATEYELEDARQEYEDAKKELDEYMSDKNWFERGSGILNFDKEYNRLSENVWDTRDAVKLLEDDLEKIDDALLDVGKEMGYAQSAADDILSGMSQTGADTGYNYASGVAEGTKKGIELVKEAAEKLSFTPDGVLRGAWEIHSPSKKAERLAEYYGEGLVNGLKNSEAEIETEMNRIASMFDIAGVVAENLKKAQAQIEAGFSSVSAAEQQFYRAMSDTVGGNGVTGGLAGVGNNLPAANITIVNELDGREIGREVARVQYGDAQITARTKGVR